MKVFISWSGDRSKAVAELLDKWIQCVIQSVDPWMSSKDIDRGALWFAEINDELANTNVGIICLTKENKSKPWILFESGALAKGLSSARVCTFLIDLDPTDLENPLAQFNHTVPTKAGMYQLVRTINFSTGSFALKDQILESVFDTYWPQFESSFKDILEAIPVTEVKEKRKQDDILLEVLSSVRQIDKRLRSVESGNSNNFESPTYWKYDSVIDRPEKETRIPINAIREAENLITSAMSVDEMMQTLITNYGISSKAARNLLQIAGRQINKSTNNIAQ